MTALFKVPADFDPEQLMKGIRASLADSDVSRILRLLDKLRASVGTPAAHPNLGFHIRDAEAALETYNRRLGEAKVAAGFVS
jgi:hypothetical protein